MGVTPRDEMWMRHALELAGEAESRGEVPIGAVVVKRHQIIGSGSNRPIGLCDPSAHAEIMALRAAGRHSGNYRLPGTTLYVTLEPCVMCMGAIVHARVERLVFGAYDPGRGAAGSALQLHQAEFLNHRVEVVGGVLLEACETLIRAFFDQRRRNPVTRCS